MPETAAGLTSLFIEHDVFVSTYDTDFAGHVSNISYLRWFEDMRLKLFDKYFPLSGFLDEGKTPVIAATNIHYKRPVKLFEKPHGVMWVSKMGQASMTISAELHVGDELRTVVEHVGVFIDLATGRPIRLPSLCVDLFKNANEVVPLKR